MQQQAVQALIRTFKILIQKNLVFLHKGNTIIITQFLRQDENKEQVWIPSKQVRNQINQAMKCQYYKSFTNTLKVVANSHRLKHANGQKFSLKRAYHRGREATQRLFLITIPKQFIQFNVNTSLNQNIDDKAFSLNENSQHIQLFSQELDPKQEDKMSEINSNQSTYQQITGKDSQISLHNALKEQQKAQKNKNSTKINLFVFNEHSKNILQQNFSLNKRLQQLMNQQNYDQTQENFQQAKKLIAETTQQLLSFYKANSSNQFESRQQQKNVISQEIMKKITLIFDLMGENIQKIDQILNVSPNVQGLTTKKQRDSQSESLISNFKSVEEKDHN